MNNKRQELVRLARSLNIRNHNATKPAQYRNPEYKKYTIKELENLINSRQRQLQNNKPVSYPIEFVRNLMYRKNSQSASVKKQTVNMVKEYVKTHNIFKNTGAYVNIDSGKLIVPAKYAVSNNPYLLFNRNIGLGGKPPKYGFGKANTKPYYHMVSSRKQLREKYQKLQAKAILKTSIEREKKKENNLKKYMRSLPVHLQNKILKEANLKLENLKIKPGSLRYK